MGRERDRQRQNWRGMMFAGYKGRDPPMGHKTGAIQTVEGTPGGSDVGKPRRAGS